MTTKFLLHGGAYAVPDQRNDGYFRETSKGLRDADEVLFIGFARTDPKDRLEAYERDRNFLISHADADIRVINATQENLVAQSARAKSIFIAGGSTIALLNDIRQHDGFIDTLRGKTVAGSSAGANIFATQYFSSRDGICNGLGTLPIKLMPHYQSPNYNSNEKTRDLLAKAGDDLELIALEECEWIIKEVDI